MTHPKEVAPGFFQTGPQAYPHVPADLIKPTPPETDDGAVIVERPDPPPLVLRTVELDPSGDIEPGKSVGVFMKLKSAARVFDVAVEGEARIARVLILKHNLTVDHAAGESWNSKFRREMTERVPGGTFVTLTLENTGSRRARFTASVVLTDEAAAAPKSKVPHGGVAKGPVSRKQQPLPAKKSERHMSKVPPAKQTSATLPGDFPTVKVAASGYAKLRPAPSAAHLSPKPPFQTGSKVKPVKMAAGRSVQRAPDFGRPAFTTPRKDPPRPVSVMGGLPSLESIPEAIAEAPAPEIKRVNITKDDALRLADYLEKGVVIPTYQRPRLVHALTTTSPHGELELLESDLEKVVHTIVQRISPTPDERALLASRIREAANGEERAPDTAKTAEGVPA